MAASNAPTRLAPFLIALLALGAATAFAQYDGPVQGREANEPLRTVAEVLKNPKDDQAVRLTGVLAKKTAKEKYLFRDDTGEIRVDIDEEDFPDIPVNEKTRVQIVGEIDKNFLRAPEIDARRVMVLGEAK